MDSLRRICLFVCTIYANFWFATPLASTASANDLQMLQLIELYAHVHNKIVKDAQSKMRLHLWYLSEDLAALPLFRATPPMQTKRLLSTHGRENHFQKMFVVLLQPSAQSLVISL